MIKTVMFDFAGVVSVGRLFSVVDEQLSQKYNIDKQFIIDRLYANHVEYLLGNESTETFWKKVCEGLSISLEDFIAAFQSWELNQETVDYILELKKKYRIVLVSDNFDASTEYLRSQPIFNEMFEKMYFSNEIHLMKGGPEIFQYVLDDLNAKAEECVFIDDQEKNLDAPKLLGINCILFTSVDQLKTDFKTYE